MRIAMWSGPNDISAQMLRAFANRADFAVRDDPFGGTAPSQAAIAGLTAPMAQRPGRPHVLYRLLTDRLPPEAPLDWATDLVSVHLICHPASAVAGDGIDRTSHLQAEIHHRLGGVVIDSDDIRANPEAMLRKLCNVIGLAFDPAMLTAFPQRQAKAERPPPDRPGAAIVAEALSHYHALWQKRLRPAVE